MFLKYLAYLSVSQFNASSKLDTELLSVKNNVIMDPTLLITALESVSLILENNCVACHSSSYKSGNLALDNFEVSVAGIMSGSVLVVEYWNYYESSVIYGIVKNEDIAGWTQYLKIRSSYTT